MSDKSDKSVLEIDGARFDSLRGFYDEISVRLIPGADWGRNLDAFNDILRGGFGTPDNGFVLRWRHSERSREVLGWEETVRYIDRKLTTCHPDNVSSVKADLNAAKREEGQTLFDIIEEIVRCHCSGGEEQEDGLVLELL